MRQDVRSSFLVVACVLLSACGTVVRVVDSTGKPISDAEVKSQQFSMGGWIDCGKTNRDGKRRIWPKALAIESIRVTKDGYMGSQLNVYGHDELTFVLRSAGGNPGIQSGQLLPESLAPISWPPAPTIR